MIKQISIRIDNDSTAEEIFPHLKEWVLMNFQPTTDVLFEIAGTNQKVTFSMKEYVKVCQKEIKKEKQEKDLKLK